MHKIFGSMALLVLAVALVSPDPEMPHARLVAVGAYLLAGAFLSTTALLKIGHFTLRRTVVFSMCWVPFMFMEDETFEKMRRNNSWFCRLLGKKKNESGQMAARSS